MKTLKEHVILYDESCPMCNLYTKAFVQYQFLDKEGRASYQNIPESFSYCVNTKRAVNEIALVNKKTGEVTYGVNSLIKIVSQRFIFLQVLFQYKAFNWLATKAYRFISYNRRVIMPAVKRQEKQHEPSLHRGYRVAYLLFTWIISAFVLNAYSKTLATVLPPSNLTRELLICGGQIVWQSAIICILTKEKAWDYLGNLMTISLAGSLVLCLGLLLKVLFTINTVYYALAFFFVVVCLMFLEHLRRTSLLQLSWVLTFSWIAYRCIVLIFIL